MSNRKQETLQMSRVVLENFVRSVASSRKAFRIVLAILAVALGGLSGLATYFIEVLGASSESLRATLWTAFTIVLILSLILQLLVAFFPEHDYESSLVVLEMAGQFEGMENLTDRFLALSAAITASLELTEGYCLSQDEHQIEQIIENISIPFWHDADSREHIFNVGRGDLHNLTVYKYDATANVLKSVYREASPDFEKTGREWHVGEGVAGWTYKHGELVSVGDLTNGWAQEKDDSKKYRSAIAAPICHIDQVWGVIVITSSEPFEFRAQAGSESEYEFDIVCSEAIRALARMIGIAVMGNERKS